MPAVAQELIDAVVAMTLRTEPLIVGVTGGIAAGKSTVAAALAQALGYIPSISTDGFIRADAGERKGYPDSYDAAALQGFLDAIRTDGKATAPHYSHLHYDVVGYDDITSDRIVIDGLHLGHPALGVRDRIDVLVHLDAPTDTLSAWYLGRFQELRTLARDDETAMLYPNGVRAKRPAACMTPREC